MSKTKYAASLSLFLIAVAGPAIANEEAAAENEGAYTQKQQACGACHGEKGDKPLAPDYPVLAGQKADYLAAALRHYRDGRRNHPIMSAQVQALQLTEADILRLAEYFSQQKGPLSILK